MWQINFTIPVIQGSEAVTIHYKSVEAADAGARVVGCGYSATFTKFKSGETLYGGSFPGEIRKKNKS